MLKEIQPLVLKEFKTEIRQKHTLFGFLLYVLSTVFIAYLAVKHISTPATWNALFWIILLFAAVNSSSKSFIGENKGRQLYYYTLASPQAVIISKIIYNCVMTILLSLLSYVFYSLLMNNLVGDNSLFLLCIFLGSMGFASSLTLISAIASKTNNNFGLVAVLGLPVVVPILLAVIRISKNAVDGLALSVSINYLLVLVFLNIIVWALAYLLFPYLWRD